MAGTSFIGTYKGKQSGQRRVLRGKVVKQATFATKVKNVIKKVAEPKHYNGTATHDIYHSKVYSKNLISPVTTGSTAVNREGDRIYVDALKLSGWYSYQPGNPFPDGQLCRLMVIASTQQPGQTGYDWLDSSGTGWNNGQLGYGSGYQDFPSLIIDPKLATVLYDNTFTMTPEMNSAYALTTNGTNNIPSGVSSLATNRLYPLRKTVKIGRTINFRTGLSSVSKQNLFLLFGAISTTTGASTASNIGYLTMSTDLIFKELD